MTDSVVGTPVNTSASSQSSQSQLLSTVVRPEITCDSCLAGIRYQRNTLNPGCTLVTPAPNGPTQSGTEHAGKRYENPGKPAGGRHNTTQR